MWQKLFTTVGSALRVTAAIILPVLFRFVIPCLVAFVLWVTDGLWAFLGEAWDVLPEEAQVDFEPFLELLNTANAWYPLQEWFEWTFLYYAFFLTFLAVRTVVRSIPTLA